MFIFHPGFESHWDHFIRILYDFVILLVTYLSWVRFSTSTIFVVFIFAHYLFVLFNGLLYLYVAICYPGFDSHTYLFYIQKKLINLFLEVIICLSHRCCIVCFGFESHLSLFVLSICNKPLCFLFVLLFHAI